MASWKESRALLISVAVFIGAPVAYYYLGFDHSTVAASKADDDAEALAVETLPPGVEQQWLPFVDDRVRKLIQRRGNILVVKDMMTVAMGQEGSFVSINMPFSIDCTMVGTISFGASEHTIDAYVFFMANNGLDQDKLTTPDAKAVASVAVPVEPSLGGVSPMSKAAMLLRGKLCARMADDLQALLKT